MMRSDGPTGTDTEIVVVGAGASGLSVAAALRRRGRSPVVLERDDQIGQIWARRYERLCLHTIRRFSGLPFYPIPRSFPKYVPKDLYARYLGEYANRLELDVRLGQTVARLEREGPRWVVATPDAVWHADALVIATGKHNQPRPPGLPGTDRFRGRLLHSGDYRTGSDFAGQRALVVGIGNSGAEIAADLVEQDAASVAVAVRTTPPISSREIAGIPVQLLGIALMPFPPRLVDRIGAALRRRAHGDLTRYGLGPEAWGPFTARRPAVIDVGFLGQLRAGRIEVLPAVVEFTSDGVEFADGRRRAFDVVIAATGFTTGLERLVGPLDVLDDRGFPCRQGGSQPGLFFAGFSETPRGLLFESSRAAPRLATAVDRYLEGLR